MKSFRAWSLVHSELNVWRAWREFARGKRRRPAVAEFASDAAREVVVLADELREQRYLPSGYRVLRIVDPKRRIVAAAPVRDRVAQRALHRVLSPRIDRGFSAQSYACLDGRGSHRAILRFLAEIRRHQWVLQLDVRRYFYSIDRERLFALLAARLREPELRGLVRTILDSGERLYRDPSIVEFLGWSGPAEPGRGLPIGNLTSQWWANVYLDGLDHFAQRVLRVQSYQRYMDDFTIFGDDRARLVDARDRIAEWLARERGLELKDSDARPRRTGRWHRYLGYRVSPVGVEPGERMRRRVRELLRERSADPRRLRATLVSLRGAWMFGS